MSFLADDALAWADRAWDESRGLLWNPPGSFDDYGLAAHSMHMVPQSAWYAVGLLARGDDARAERVLGELCALQYRQPGTVWHGTFARFAEWPEPSDGAVEWIDYDPNWRQFLGTTFALVLATFDVSAALATHLREAIELAIEGEPRDRVSPGYSNIALMKAWLERDESFGRAVVDVFDEHGAFEEYGSPTYYGIDLYALALWRLHPPTPQFAVWGERLWSALWTDIVRWWHPRLGNLCGPYSRAYGMDMHEYVGLLGLWLPDAVVPALDTTFEHSHDLTLAPVVGLLQPAPVDLELRDDERVVEQALPGPRVASGWLGPDAMLGGERGGRYRAEGQYHPATAHWLLPDGSIGWLRLRHRGRLSATANAGRLDVEVHDHRRHGRQPVTVESSHPGRFGVGTWRFAGRAIDYEGPSADANGVIDAGDGDVLTLRLA